MGKNKSKHLQPHPNRQVLVQQQHFSGPLPLPQHLEKYDQIVPGAANRILIMAETQAKHRWDLEARVIKSDIMNSKLGLIFGLIIGLAGLWFGYELLQLGKIVEGSIFGGATLVALVSTFIYGSQQRRKERAERRQEQQ